MSAILSTATPPALVERSRMGRAALLLLNLVVPGTGLVGSGALVSGILAALLFTATANFAILAAFLFPDDFGFGWQFGGWALTLGAWVAAQWRLAGVRSAADEAVQSARRRVCLQVAQACLVSGDAAGARAALEPVGDLAESDLLVAYRRAQALAAMGANGAARDAWRTVRRLDPHGLYREEVREIEAQLGAPGMPERR